MNLLKRHTVAASCSRFSCTDCPYKTDDGEQFENHRKPEDCEDFRKKKKKCSVVVPVDKKVCDLCYKTFCSQPSLVRHKKNIHGEFSERKVKGNGKNFMKEEIIKSTTVDSVEILLKAEEEEETHSEENDDFSPEKDIFEKPTFLCPVGSCQFVIDSYDEKSRKEHFQTFHTNVDFPVMTFLKLEM